MAHAAASAVLGCGAAVSRLNCVTSPFPCCGPPPERPFPAISCGASLPVPDGLGLFFPCWFLWRTNKPSLLFGPCVAGPSNAAHLLGPATQGNIRKKGASRRSRPGTESSNPQRRAARQRRAAPLRLASHTTPRPDTAAASPKQPQKLSCSSPGLSRAGGLPKALYI